MFDSQTIQMQGTTTTELYSPWFPRGGDYGLFTLEVTAIGGSSPSLTVTLVHKNSSDTGNGDPTAGSGGGNITRTTAGRTTFDYAAGIGSSPTFAGFEELVRYKYTLSGGASNITSWATFRMLAPAWYDKV
jgi:hypothetical protein